MLNIWRVQIFEIIDNFKKYIKEKVNKNKQKTIGT